MPAATVIRVDGYVRVSRVGARHGERFISPAVQREQIEAWALSREATLLRVFEELDESGSRADRPLLDEAIGRAEEGVTDGLVVSKVNRFGRSLIDGLVLIERVRTAGARFYSVVDGLDTGTDAGRLVLRIMLSMAEWDLERIRADWVTAKERAVRRGVFVNRAVPVGYRKTRAGRLKLDPRTAPVMAEVFRRRAAGESAASLCRFLEANDVATALGNPGWITTTLYRVLQRRDYLGELRVLSAVNENAHPALVDPGTWQKAQAPRQITRWTRARPVLLGGLVRCASCSMALTTVRRHTNDDVTRTYQCRIHFARGTCPAPTYVTGHYLDSYVTDSFFKLLSRRRRPPAVGVATAEQKLAALSASLASYRDSDRLRSILSEDQFAAGLLTRTERVRNARIAVADLRARAATHELPSVPELRRTWPSLDVLERRALISQVIDCVFVARGRNNLEQRVTICPTGTAPRGLARQGGNAVPVRAIKPRRGWINPTGARASP